MKTVFRAVTLLGLAWLLAGAAATPDVAGVWKWTTIGRNGQPEETVLKLAVQNGVVTGTISDRSGTRPVTGATVHGNGLDFSVQRETPNGKHETKYSLKLDGDKPKLTIERPGFSFAKGESAKADQARKTEVEPTREPHGPPADLPRPKQ